MNAEPSNIAMAINLEAEQALLGAILATPTLIDELTFLEPHHFAGDVHQRIYATCLALTRRGRLAVPAALKKYFTDDPDLADLGGAAYLARLSAYSTVRSGQIVEYGRALVELWQARAAAEICIAAAEAFRKPTPETTITEALERVQTQLAEIHAEGPQPRPKALEGLVGDVLQHVQNLKNGESTMDSTGMPALDRLIGGFGGGRAYFLAGRPGMGKTALGLGLCDSVVSANEGTAAAFFSLEMGAQELVIRLASARASTDAFKVPYSYAAQGKINDAQLAALANAETEMRSLPIFIDDTPARTAAAIRAEARRLQRDLKKRGIRLALVVVDHLRKIKDSGRFTNANKVEGEKAGAMKDMAKELDVPVIVLVQLSRAVESRDNKRPTLGDLRDSGEIEEEADVVIFPYRDHYYKRREKPPASPVDAMNWEAELKRLSQLMEIIVEKNRHGEPGREMIGCDIGTNRFYELGGGAAVSEDDLI